MPLCAQMFHPCCLDKWPISISAFATRMGINKRCLWMHQLKSIQSKGHLLQPGASLLRVGSPWGLLPHEAHGGYLLGEPPCDEYTLHLPSATVPRARPFFPTCPDS